MNNKNKIKMKTTKKTLLLIMLSITSIVFGQEEISLDDNNIKIIKEKAEKGDAESQYQYATICMLVDKDKVFYWMKKSAEQGNKNGQLQLGLMYKSGKGISKDKQKALYWFEKSAKQGDKVAQYYAGVMYYYELGNKEKAFYWYKKSAIQGHPISEWMIGGMLATGEGVKIDEEQGIMWIKRSAQKGYIQAQYSLGFSYLVGRILSIDRHKATYWIKKAFENRDTRINNKYEIIHFVDKAKETWEKYELWKYDE